MTHYIGPIERGIPIPSDQRRTRRSPIIIRLSALQPGDSFITDIPYAHIHTFAARLNITVATKYDTPGRIRVWKVKERE